MSRPPRLGGWMCPSGNSVDVYLLAGDGSLRHVMFEWDAPPPLIVADELYYIGIILPAVTRRVQEYLEKPGRALVVQL